MKKINIKKLIESVKFINTINQIPMGKVDFKHLFILPNKTKMEKFISNSISCGLTNVDVLLSNMPMKYGLKRKFKFSIN